MTPKDALTRECRQVEPTLDEATDMLLFAKCSADRCMFWRWFLLPKDAAFDAAVEKAKQGEKRYPHAAALQHVLDNRAAYGLPTKPTSGFCGLAGKPEVQ